MDNNSNYLLHWWEKTTRPVLQKRPWWNIFGKDELVLQEQWIKRKVNLNKREVDSLIKIQNDLNASSLVLKIIKSRGEAWGLQCESLYEENTEYIKTTGSNKS